MDRRRLTIDENQSSTSASKNNPNNKVPAKIRFEYEDDDDRFQDPDETLEEAATESSNLEEDFAMCEPDPDDACVIGADKTSADYYFDSYSHFGIHLQPNFTLSSFFFFFLLEFVELKKEKLKSVHLPIWFVVSNNFWIWF